MLYFENFNLETFHTPVDADKLEELLIESNYDPTKRDFVVKGFRKGFDLGYRGRKNVQIRSPNLKFAVGDEIDLWNKVMKEVKLLRYAGPFKDIPYKNYIQSPIGLVPKDQGRDMRLIFHLSYPKNGKKSSSSVNANTPQYLCKVKYPDFSEAIQKCIEEGYEICYLGRSDVRAAFRILGIAKRFWKYLVMKARNPVDGKWYFFIDKNLPFGSSVSCVLFQAVSDCLAHLVQFRTGKRPVNYLDDYLFVALLKLLCNRQLQTFLDICAEIGVPISIEKTFWASTRITFLGFMIDTVLKLILIPVEKIAKAKNMINFVLAKTCKGKSGKLTVLQLQRICGFLNFLGRAILPGRAFTRRLYAPLQNNRNLRPHHHVKISGEMKQDLITWYKFINHPSIFCRNFMDFSKTWEPEELDFYVDASKNPLLGFGGYCERDYMVHQWQDISHIDPSIGYLELYAITAAVIAWIHRFANKKVVIFTDNKGAEFMVNKTSSNCKNCMVLIRIIVLKCLVHNVRLYARHVSSAANGISDSLSRLQFKRFRRLTRKRKMNREPTLVSNEIWPISKIWSN